MDYQQLLEQTQRSLYDETNLLRNHAELEELVTELVADFRPLADQIDLVFVDYRSSQCNVPTEQDSTPYTYGRESIDGRLRALKSDSSEGALVKFKQLLHNLHEQMSDKIPPELDLTVVTNLLQFVDTEVKGFEQRIASREKQLQSVVGHVDRLRAEFHAHQSNVTDLETSVIELESILPVDFEEKKSLISKVTVSSGYIFEHCKSSLSVLLLCELMMN